MAGEASAHGERVRELGRKARDRITYQWLGVNCFASLMLTPGIIK
jgi:hypothetical protein